jgi:hypothetical protein
MNETSPTKTLIVMIQRPSLKPIPWGIIRPIAVGMMTEKQVPAIAK